MEAYCQKASGRYQVRVINRDGSIHREYKWKPNLILDSGLDFVGTSLWGNCWRYCAVGTGTTPVVDDSGTITATQTGTTVTANASVFAAGDVGKLLAFDTGEEAYITSFSSNTQVEVSVSRTIGSGTSFAMWRVNQTQLDTYVQHSTTYVGGGSFNGTTVLNSGVTFRMKRTWQFPTEVSDTTYYELGFHKDDSSNPTLFSRVMNEDGYAVAADQQIQVTYELTLSFGTTARVSETLSITGWPISPASSTDANVGFCKIPITVVDDNGATIANAGGGTSHTIAEPSNSNATVDINSNSTFPAFGNNPSVSQTNYTATLDSYVAGSFSRRKTWEIAHGTTQTNLRQLVHITNTAGNEDVGWMALFDESQTKYSTHSLVVTLEWTWARILAENP